MYKSLIEKNPKKSHPCRTGKTHPPSVFSSKNETPFVQSPRTPSRIELLSPLPSNDDRPRIMRQKVYPRDSPPKTIYLPFLPQDKDFGRFVETDSTGIGNHMRMVRSRQKVKQPTPKWLIALEGESLEGIMTIKKALSTMKDPCELIDTLFNTINQELKIVVKKDEISQVLLDVPYDSIRGPSFSHFMYTMANYSVASLTFRRVYSQVFPKLSVCEEYMKSDDDQCESNSGRSSPVVAGGKAGSCTAKSSTSSVSTSQKKKNFSLREKVFYSGLLIYEMYNTLSNVEKLYFQNWIPETLAALARNNILQGVKSGTVDIKRKGLAEWDKPLPPVSKISPYVSSIPFVTSRIHIIKPSADEKGRRRTLTNIQPMHLVIKPSRKFNQPIKIIEDKQRIRQALVFLAAHGDCVALLPDIHLIIHVSDTFVDKLEEISTNPVKTIFAPRPKIYYNNELAWVARESKTLYRLHGIPVQIAKLSHLIKYTDGLNLRTICAHIRNQHWTFLCNRKLDFRIEAWNRMHVDLIPPGHLEDSFIYAFVTYLPYISHLPIDHYINPNPV